MVGAGWEKWQEGANKSLQVCCRLQVAGMLQVCCKAEAGRQGGKFHLRTKIGPTISTIINITTISTIVPINTISNIIAINTMEFYHFILTS